MLQIDADEYYTAVILDAIGEIGEMHGSRIMHGGNLAGLYRNHNIFSY